MDGGKGDLISKGDARLQSGWRVALGGDTPGCGRSLRQPLAVQTSSGKPSPLQLGLLRPAGRLLPRLLGRPAPVLSSGRLLPAEPPPRCAEPRGRPPLAPIGGRRCQPSPSRALPRRDGPPHVPVQPPHGSGAARGPPRPPAAATPLPAARRAALPAAALAVPRAVLPRQAGISPFPPSFPPSLSPSAAAGSRLPLADGRWGSIRGWGRDGSAPQLRGFLRAFLPPPALHFHPEHAGQDRRGGGR